MAIHQCTAQAGWQGLADLLGKASAGDEIHLEAGTYHGTAALSLPSGVRLIGTEGVILRQDGEGPILTITGSDCELSKVSFSSTREGQNCVRITDAERVLVSECLCDGGGVAPAAIYVERSQQITIQSCTAHSTKIGIVFFSSTGRAEANECWGNTRSGIVLDRGYKTSQVTLVGNRCHDNIQAGILFLSSTGRAEANECWGNTLSGILLQHHPDALNHPSEVTLVGNRCHDNTQTGIAFFSSTGRAEANECWGNTVNGISIRRNSNTPDHPSEVTLVGNRCHDNTEVGILFSNSTGRAEANECWGNQDNEISPEDGSEIYFHNHRTFPSQSPKELRRSRLLLHPLGPWFTNPLVINHPHAEGLADFLHSGGCPDCFSHFWTGGTQAAPTRPPISTQTAVPADDRIRTYVVRPSQDQSVTIHRTTVPPGRATAPRTGLEGLTALLSRFSHLVKTRSQNDLPLKWAVGFITAEPTVETTFTEWLTAAKSHDPTMEGRSIECARYGPDSTADLSSKLEQVLLAPYRTWRERLRARVEALLFMPAREALIVGMTMLLLSLLSLLVLAHTFDMPYWPLPESGSALAKALTDLSSNILDQWSDHITIMGTIAGAWIVVLLFLWNRNLPRGLHFSLTFLMATFRAIAEPGPIKEVLQATPLKRLWDFIQSLACSQTSRRFWLRRQLYGYRLFERLRPGVPPPRLIAFLNVDIPTQADLEDMRLVLEICPKNQSIVVITQMSGLSMLTSAYLDVWFPKTAPTKQRPPTAYILHDLDAGMIQPLPDIRATTMPGDEAPILESLDQLLGWSAPEHGLDQRHEVRTKYGNTLILRTWSFQEFLLALVIGSTPYTHMMVQGPYTASSHQYRTDFLDALTPYLTVLALDREAAQLDLATSEPCIERGEALLPVKVDKSTQLQWVGRGGYRRALADLIRQWYAYCAEHRLSTDRKADESEPYLAHLLICGELYNVIRLTVLVDTLPTSPDLARNHQLLPLHIEAACALVEERLAISPVTAEPSVLLDQWQAFVTRVLRQDGGPLLTEPERARLCTMYLKATARYRQQGRNDLGRQEEEELTAVIADPFRSIEGTTLWAAFLRDVASLLRRLAYRETATASALLTAKLSQEWCAFPDALKETLRNQCANFPRDWIEDMGRQHSVEMLLERAQRLREQPALVVGALSRLAVASLGNFSSETDRTSLLIKIADAVLRLRRAAGDDAPSVQLEPWKQFPAPEAISAATALLCDEAHVQRLCRILEDGAKSRENLRRAAESVTCPIEGIALGVHGHLDKVLELAKEADEVTVMGSTGTSKA